MQVFNLKHSPQVTTLLKDQFIRQRIEEWRKLGFLSRTDEGFRRQWFGHCFWPGTEDKENEEIGRRLVS